MPKRSKSSERWLQRQRKDYFVRKAQDGGQVSRAHYKLEQIDQRFNLLTARKRVLELGAAPGGWTQYLESKLTRGFLIAVDPLPITGGGRCRVIEGYAGEDEVNAKITSLLADQQLDLVLSDMAPNISGVRAVDQARAMDLADIALAAQLSLLRFPTSAGPKLAGKGCPGFSDHPKFEPLFEWRDQLEAALMESDLASV